MHVRTVLTCILLCTVQWCRVIRLIISFLLLFILCSFLSIFLFCLFLPDKQKISVKCTHAHVHILSTHHFYTYHLYLREYLSLLSIYIFGRMDLYLSTYSSIRSFIYRTASRPLIKRKQRLSEHCSSMLRTPSKYVHLTCLHHAALHSAVHRYDSLSENYHTFFLFLSCLPRYFFLTLLFFSFYHMHVSHVITFLVSLTPQQLLVSILKQTRYM